MLEVPKEYPIKGLTHGVRQWKYDNNMYVQHGVEAKQPHPMSEPSKKAAPAPRREVPTPFRGEGRHPQGGGCCPMTRSAFMGERRRRSGERRNVPEGRVLLRRAAVNTRRSVEDGRGVPALGECRPGRGSAFPYFMGYGEEGTPHQTTPFAPGRSKTSRVTACLNDMVVPKRGSMGAATNSEDSVPMKTPISMVSAKP